MAKKKWLGKPMYFIIFLLVLLGVGGYLFMNYMQTDSKAALGLNSTAAMACYTRNSKNKCPLSNFGNNMSPQQLKQFAASITISECKFCLAQCFLNPDSQNECRIK